MMIDLKNYKTWGEAEYKLNQIFNGFVGLFITEDEQHRVMREHKKEWNKLHKIERNEDIDIKEVKNNIDIKEIPHDNKNEIQTQDKVIMTNGLFKNLIGKVTDIFKTKNIIHYVVLMSDENTLNIPETDLKLYEKAECNLPKAKEEVRNDINILGDIKDVKVIIEPHKTKVQLMNGIFGDTSHGYEDEDYDKEENIRVAYIHAIRHWCKVLLREEE